ncbi:MAG TPA: hypothetical protein VKU41_26920 [Polyangiaceae bacterium]|nr:hypothetical protein [Polyangiaceae bacterium]
MGTLGSDAIVIGGGMGGLMAARVLSDHFDRVTILERDGTGDAAEGRPGVPQGKHVHTLLAAGQRVLGFFSAGLTRPQLELCVRQRVKQIANVALEGGVASPASHRGTTASPSEAFASRAAGGPRSVPRTSWSTRRAPGS